tara:strand:+ start:95 stop:541 length:447 start_codon:yes stop_codon:yes gene_type:complete
MVEVLNLLSTYRLKFDDDDWYGRKAGSICGSRSDEVIALIRKKGGSITRETVSKVHKEFNKTVGGNGEVEVNATKAKALLKKVNEGEVKISHLINGTKPSNGASAQQRSQSVSMWAKAFARVVNGEAAKLVADDEVKALKDALNRLPW